MSLKKRAVREFCFQYFFHLQLPVFEELRKTLIQDGDQQQIKNSINDFKESTNTMLSDEHDKYVMDTVTGTLKHYTEIEDIISRNLKNWKLGRLSKVDHTNLLLSTYEICFAKDTPNSVVINEAVEISKKYGNQDSSAFINGILDNIAKGK